MNYEALIEALQLKKYSKLISESTITSVKLSKKNKIINVFYVLIKHGLILFTMILRELLNHLVVMNVSYNLW